MSPTPKTRLPRISSHGTAKSEVAARLLLAGRRAFGESGLYAARVEEITSLAGIAKGTFYLYFENKEQLIRAIADEALRELARVSRQAAELTPGWPERLGAIARAHLDFFAEHPDWMRILHQLRGMLKFGRLEWQSLRQILDRYVEEDLAALLRKPPAPVELRDEVGVSLARVFLGAISGSASVWVSCEGPDSGRRPPDALVPALIEFATSFVSAAASRRRPSKG